VTTQNKIKSRIMIKSVTQHLYFEEEANK
jgi:hypothetical protein